MTEEKKLKKYATYMVGFAYELIPVGIYDYDLTFFIVVPNGDKYDFIKYKKIARLYKSRVEETIIEFRAKPINYWLEKNIIINENKYNLVYGNVPYSKVLRFKKRSY